MPRFADLCTFQFAELKIHAQQWDDSNQTHTLLGMHKIGASHKRGDLSIVMTTRLKPLRMTRQADDE